MEDTAAKVQRLCTFIGTRLSGADIAYIMGNIGERSCLLIENQENALNRFDKKNLRDFQDLLCEIAEWYILD